MNTFKPVIIIMGPQGSGKGTQGKKLADKLQIPYLEAGQLLREEIASGSEQGKYIASIVDAGGLLPDEFISNFMKDKITNAVTGRGGVIVDGFPRRIAQAEVFDEVTKPTHVILIDIPDQESIRRLSARRSCPKDDKIYNLITAPPKNDELCDDCQTKLEQRVDDTPEAIKYRLEQYHRDTEPVLEHYQKRGILHRIDGRPSIPEVEQGVWQVFA